MEGDQRTRIHTRWIVPRDVFTIFKHRLARQRPIKHSFLHVHWRGKRQREHPFSYIAKRWKPTISTGGRKIWRDRGKKITERNEKENEKKGRAKERKCKTLLQFRIWGKLWHSFRYNVLWFIYPKIRHQLFSSNFTSHLIPICNSVPSNIKFITILFGRTCFF